MVESCDVDGGGRLGDDRTCVRPGHSHRSKSRWPDDRKSKYEVGGNEKERKKKKEASQRSNRREKQETGSGSSCLVNAGASLS